MFHFLNVKINIAMLSVGACFVAILVVLASLLVANVNAIEKVNNTTCPLKINLEDLEGSDFVKECWKAIYAEKLIIEGLRMNLQSYLFLKEKVLPNSAPPEERKAHLDKILASGKSIIEGIALARAYGYVLPLDIRIQVARI